MNLDLDTEIRFPSGERAGFLRKVVVGENGQASAVVMGTDEIISRARIVPLDALSEEPGGGLLLSLSPEETDRLPVYEEEQRAEAEGWQTSDDAWAVGEVFPATVYQPIMPVTETSNAPGEVLSITQGTEVACLDGRWGVVDEVVVGEDGAVRAFIGRSDDFEEPLREIPVELVQEADSNQVFLNCTVADLPTYAQALEGETKEPEDF